jgi:mevalonate pyrophosphate decarboxylase
MGIFKSFFEMMKGEPATIITDEQASIISAIEQLKQDGDF